MATKASSISADFYVYALFRENGVPFYIGKGRGDRWRFHEWEARKGAPGHKCNIIRSMQERGLDVARVKLHEGLTEAVANEYEIAFIAAIGRHPIGPLVNGTDGGDGVAGGKHTPEARAKMSETRKGRKLTAEAIAKRSDAVRGRPKSPETREKIAAAQRGKKRRKMTPEEIARRTAKQRGIKRSTETLARMSASQIGKIMSAEARAKVSAAQRGRKHTPEHIANCVAGRLGRKRTPEARANMKEAAIRREAAQTPEERSAIAQRREAAMAAARAALLINRQLSFSRHLEPAGS